MKTSYNNASPLGSAKVLLSIIIALSWMFATAQTPPTPPVALPPAFVSNTGFEAMFYGTINTYNYEVEISPVEDFSVPVDAEIGSRYQNPALVQHLTVGGLSPNSQFYYRVRAVNNGVLTAYSETIAVRTQPHPTVGSPNIWAVGFEGSSYVVAQSMVEDDDGYLYIAGYFEESLHMGSFTLSSQGVQDIFIAKLDADHNVLWARSIGGPGQEIDVTLAVEENHLYMMARTSGSFIDVDPGPGSTIFDQTGLEFYDGFFGRYSANDGALEWAYHLTDASGERTSIAVDKKAVYITGNFVGSVDFDPTAGAFILNSVGEADIFVAKYSLQGKLIWAEQIGGEGQASSGGILIDGKQMYIYGSFYIMADFDPGIGERVLYGSHLGGQGFFGQYDTETGKLVYVRGLGIGTIYTIGAFKNKIYVGGEAYRGADVDPGPGEYLIHSDAAEYSGLIAQYDARDGSFGWANTIRCSEVIRPLGVFADASGVYVNGFQWGSGDFDGGPIEANRTSAQVSAFSANYGHAGNLRWAKAIGSPGSAQSQAAVLTKTAYYIAGRFASSVNFDPYHGSVYLNNSDQFDDLFVAKYERSQKDHGKPWSHDEHGTANRKTREDSEGLLLFPNPASDRLTIRVEQFAERPVEFSIMDVLGRVTIAPWAGSGEQSVNIGQIPPGIHFVTARQGEKILVRRFIKK